MTLDKNLDSQASAILSLRGSADAVRVITDFLKVKEMGPADHIRTKHEVKEFLETGDLDSAKDLLRRVDERRLVKINVGLKVVEKHGQRISG